MIGPVLGEVRFFRVVSRGEKIRRTLKLATEHVIVERGIVRALKRYLKWFKNLKNQFYSSMILNGIGTAMDWVFPTVYTLGQKGRTPTLAKNVMKKLIIIVEKEERRGH